jgi:prepilin-type N-terminal cleavage/methylation domain-containing protein
MSRARERRGEAGFTLLELLVSMTLLSLLLVALSGGVHFAGRAWQMQEERIGRQGDIQAVQNALRQMLASGQSFDGGAQSLRFVGKLPAALARGGLFDIELYRGDDRLLLSWRPHFKGVSASLPHDEASLLDGVTGLDLSYYLGAQGWQHVTRDKSKPVDIVAVKLLLTKDREWPPLAVAPAINAPVTNASSKPPA